MRDRTAIVIAHRLSTVKHAHSPQLQFFASLPDAQPPEVQEVFQFLLTTAMHEAGKQTRNPIRAILDRGKDKDHAQDHNLRRRHPL